MIKLSYEQILEKINKQTGKSESEIEPLVNNKLKALSDLISKEGAAHIVANELKANLGMDISPLYLEYSVLKNINVNQNKFTEEQKLLLETFSSKEAIELEDVNEIYNSFTNKENLFLDKKDVDSQVESTREGEYYGVKSRLIKLSLNNAPFSESVGSTVFKDPEGNLIYAHQMPTYQLEQIIEMNGKDYVINKMLESSFMSKNILLNPCFDTASFISWAIF